MIQICLPFSLTICCVVGISIKIILANKPLWALRGGGALWRSAWLQVGTCASLTWSRRPFSSSSFAKGGQTEVVDEPVGPSVLNSTQAEHWEGKKYRTRQFTVWNCGSENRAKIISAQRHFFFTDPWGDLKRRKRVRGRTKVPVTMNWEVAQFFPSFCQAFSEDPLDLGWWRRGRWLYQKARLLPDALWALVMCLFIRFLSAF